GRQGGASIRIGSELFGAATKQMEHFAPQLRGILLVRRGGASRLAGIAPTGIVGAGLAGSGLEPIEWLLLANVQLRLQARLGLGLVDGSCKSAVVGWRVGAFAALHPAR